MPEEQQTTVADLSYEQARDELVGIVARIESGAAPLEESMQLWERGEALAAHCQAQLDQAQSRLDAATQTAGNASEPADEQTHEPEQRP
ncbi:MAG: exodeoxyribonuclease VII small subunit [Actinomycetota bacterium]|jgi:exodeoxyribonuclease VII small subunit|nr:exodeoxyribonuclease VII small subunit [Actinomycetota bacterium]MDQ3527293.1 exodeoxyribonuclease VII small subunit [Actinomycetota bacterium]